MSELEGDERDKLNDLIEITEEGRVLREICTSIYTKKSEALMHITLRNWRNKKEIDWQMVFENGETIFSNCVGAYFDKLNMVEFDHDKNMVVKNSFEEVLKTFKRDKNNLIIDYNN